MYPGTETDKGEPEVDDNKAVGYRVDKEGEGTDAKGPPLVKRIFP